MACWSINGRGKLSVRYVCELTCIGRTPKTGRSIGGWGLTPKSNCKHPYEDNEEARRYKSIHSTNVYQRDGSSSHTDYDSNDQNDQDDNRNSSDKNDYKGLNDDERGLMEAFGFNLLKQLKA